MNKYAELIDCKSPDEVRERIIEWSSDLSKEEHLIRAAIIQMHANIEHLLKTILYQLLEKPINKFSDKSLVDKSKKLLSKNIQKMFFSNVYKLLGPCLVTLNDPALKNIKELNEVRNSAVHGKPDNVFYKNRNPFEEFDCLAQIYFEAWAAKQSLTRYSEIILS